MRIARGPSTLAAVIMLHACMQALPAQASVTSGSIYTEYINQQATDLGPFHGSIPLSLLSAS